MTVKIKQKIFRFEIPVDYVVFMNRLKTQKYLDKIKTSKILTHFPKFLNQSKKLPTRTKLNNENRLILWLETKF